LEYNPNEIIVSAGAKQCVFNAVNAIVYTDDEVIIPAPYYVSIRRLLQWHTTIGFYKYYGEN
jgi:aspartate aminotransferase